MEKAKDLTCSCGTPAKDEQFQGELGPEGYTCTACLRVINQETIETFNKTGKSD